MNPKLSVEIGADVKGLEAALSRADKLLKQHERNYKGVQSAIGANTQKSLQLEKSISQLNNEYKKGNISQANYSKQTDRLTTELAQVNNETADYQKELRRLDREIDRVSQSTANYAKNAQRTGAASNTAAAGMGRMGKTARVNAVPAMTSFSQVVQDAPYGIQGVANNIQQLTMQFGYLSKGAGGAKGALKAMLGSLMGPTGILLGVSLVTTLLVQFGDKLFKSGEEAKTAEEKLNDYADALRGVNKAQLDAGTSAQKELVQLRLLAQQATNTALATDERKAAVNELRRLYPSYLKGMSDEQIMANGLTTAYNEVTESIMRKARAQAASELMVKNMREEITLRNQLAALNSKIAKESKKANEEELEAQKYISDNMRASEKLIINSKAIAQRQKVNDLLKDRNELEGQIQSRELENITLNEDIKANGSLIVDPEEVKVEEGASPAPVRVPVKGVLELTAEQGSTSQVMGDWALKEIALLEQIRKTLPPISDEYKYLTSQIEMLQATIEGGNGLSQLNESALAGSEEFAEKMEAHDNYNDFLREKAREQDRIMQSMEAAVAGMVAGVVDSLIEGKFEFKEFAKSFAKTFLMMTLTSATGGGGLLAGLIGGFSGGGIAEPKGFASGGIVGGSSFSGDKLWARINSGEMVLNKDHQKSLYKQLQAPSSFGSGSNSPIVVGGAIEASGDVLRVILDRADRNRDRTT